VRVLPNVKNDISLRTMKISKKMFQSILCCGIKWNSLRFSSCVIDIENLSLQDSANCQLNELNLSFWKDDDQHNLLFDLLTKFANSNLRNTVKEIILSVTIKKSQEIKRVLDDTKFEKIIKYSVISHEGPIEKIIISFVK